jgi:chorismate-pyruvate lyase
MRIILSKCRHEADSTPPGRNARRKAMTSSPVLIAAAALCLGGPAVAQTWPDTFQARLEALAQIQQLNADLLSHDSATATLQHWCETHGSTPGQKIVALRVRGQDKAAGPEERTALGVGPAEPLRYRRVKLACGERVLSEADNWYRPSALTPEMNRALDETETPFGVVVRALDYRRRTLGAEVLFRPLPLDWETRPRPADRPGKGFTIPLEVMRHRAVLSTPDGPTFSLVVETYTDKVLFRP